MRLVMLAMALLYIHICYPAADKELEPEKIDYFSLSNFLVITYNSNEKESTTIKVEYNVVKGGSFTATHDYSCTYEPNEYFSVTRNILKTSYGTKWPRDKKITFKIRAYDNESEQYNLVQKQIEHAIALFESYENQTNIKPAR